MVARAASIGSIRRSQCPKSRKSRRREIEPSRALNIIRLAKHAFDERRARHECFTQNELRPVRLVVVSPFVVGETRGGDPRRRRRRRPTRRTTRATMTLKQAACDVFDQLVANLPEARASLRRVSNGGNAIYEDLARRTPSISLPFYTPQPTHTHQHLQ